MSVIVYITGDTHGDFKRFSSRRFLDQHEMNRDDFVIILGDFGGIWYDDNCERWWLNWLNELPFTLLFIDGNHDNFDRLNNEFEEINFHGGRAHKIRENIYHLMRGYVFELCGKKFFTFGGASSHDIQDGILDPNDYDDYDEFRRIRMKLDRECKMYRINHISWWKEELPSDEEMQRGIESLRKHGFNVDFVLTHCLPQSAATVLSRGLYELDVLTNYLDDLILEHNLKFKKWYCGHYHCNDSIFSNIEVLYEEIIRIC